MSSEAIGLKFGKTAISLNKPDPYLRILSGFRSGLIGTPNNIT